MLHVPQGQWPSSFQAGHSPHSTASHFPEPSFARSTECVFGPDRRASAQAQQSASSGLDTTYLSQRLSSFLLDIQSGSDQVQSVWDMWHGEPSQENLPFSLLDKPQTAAPPVTPPSGQFSQTSTKSQQTSSSSDHPCDHNDALASLSFDNLTLGKDDRRL